MGLFVVSALVATTLPFFLLPAICARVNAKRSSAMFAVGNVFLLLWIYYSIFSAMGGARSGFRIPGLSVDFALVLWLILLHYGVRLDASTPEDVDEPVELIAYDAAWPKEFERERCRITGTLALAKGSIEHIGSTSVPGLEAKPVIDMMLGTLGFPPPRELLSRLTILGYENLGDAGVPGRIYLRLREGAAFNLHVMQRDGEHWTNNLALREFLRRDPDARTRYAAEKKKALHTAGSRLLAYSAAKGPVMNELLTTARNR